MSKEWEDKVKELNRLHQELQQKPEEEKKGHSLSPGGLLNAYREGDIDFETATMRIRVLMETQDIQLSAQRFIYLRALCNTFEIADEPDARSASVSADPLGTIMWPIEGGVRIHVGGRLQEEDEEAET